MVVQNGRSGPVPKGVRMYNDDVVGRLEEGLRSALPDWGLSDETELSLLAVSENVTFRAKDPQSGRDVVFRVHRPGYHTLAEIASELAWLAALSSEGVVNTPKPVLQTNGDLIADIDDGTQMRHVVAFKFQPGREPEQGAGFAGWFRELGIITAKLHTHSSQWKPPRGFQRKTWNFDSMLGANPLWGNWRDAVDLSGEGREVLEETASLLRERLADYGDGPDRFGLIHADLRPSNLLIDGDRLWIIDFDDSGFSWYLYDFAAAISFLEHEPDVPDLLDAWIDGYSTIAELTDEDLAMLPVFIMLRRMLLTAWIASHPETATARRLGADYTHGTVALARAFLAEYAEAEAEEAESAGF
jgi:Ser/Thr protein kinase RdoA (MazF antagonist)